MVHPNPTPSTPNKDTARTHVVVPEDLLAEVDRLVGPRRRSQFFVDAVEEKVKRIKLVETAKKAAGSLKHVSILGWETPEETSEWVRASRRADEAKSPPNRNL